MNDCIRPVALKSTWHAVSTCPFASSNFTKRSCAQLIVVAVAMYISQLLKQAGILMRKKWVVIYICQLYSSSNTGLRHNAPDCISSHLRDTRQFSKKTRKDSFLSWHRIQIVKRAISPPVPSAPCHASVQVTTHHACIVLVTSSTYFDSGTSTNRWFKQERNYPATPCIFRFGAL